MQINKKLLPSIVLFIGLHSSVKAQEIKKYEGEVDFSWATYEASLSYYLENGDTLYEGPFRISEQGAAYGDAEPFDFLTIEGRFRRNRPHGNWKLHLGTFSPQGLGQYFDYRYSFKIDGEALNAMGRLNEGKKEGAWKLNDWIIKDSEIVDTLVQTTMFFSDDKIQGELVVGSKDMKLQGRVGSEQEATGLWVYYVKDSNGNYVPREEWRFENKRLVTRTLLKDGNAYVLEFQYDSEAHDSWEWHIIDDAYFDVLRLIAASSGNPVASIFAEENAAEQFYERFLRKLETMNAEIESFGFFSLEAPVRVEVPVYDFVRDEEREIKLIRKRLDELKELIEVINNDAQIQLASISTGEISALIAVINELNKRHVGAIDRFLEHYESGAIKHVDRADYVKRYIDFNTKLSAMIEDEDTSRSTSYDLEKVKVDPNEGAVKQLSQWTAGLLDEVKSINDSITYYMSEIKKEELLVEQEGSLMERFRALEAAIDSLVIEEQNELAGFDLRESLQKFIKAELAIYSRIESAPEREKALSDVLTCFDKTEELLNTVDNARDNYFAVRDAYTRQVFNAYTFTYMEETLKSGILKSFQEVLLPGVFRNIKELTCANIDKVDENFELLFRGMNDVLKRETRKVERKVRRVEDPVLAAELLELNLNFYKGE